MLIWLLYRKKALLYDAISAFNVVLSRIILLCFSSFFSLRLSHLLRAVSFQKDQVCSANCSSSKDFVKKPMLRRRRSHQIILIFLQSFYYYWILQQKNYKLPSMKKQEGSLFSSEVKILHKKFKILDKPNTSLLFQFCEFDIQKASKVLTIMSTFKNPMEVIKSLLEKPERSQELLNDFERRFDKQFGLSIQVEAQKTQEAQKKQAIPRLQYEFLAEVPADCIMQIMTFLDPYSFSAFAFTCSKMHRISISDARSQYYKNLCIKLFTMQVPPLPFICRFAKIKDYVLARPLEFGPNSRNAVNNNLRYYVWKSEANSFKLETNYYKSFNSYQNLFKTCPRVNFNGYYICKHKYVKIGERNAQNIYTPIHIIYYYRYLRFFQDGSVVYRVCNKKIKPENLFASLSSKNLQNNENENIIGQFMQFKDKVYVKAVKSNEIFSYEFEIKSTQNKIANELNVINYTLQLIDEAEILQSLYCANPNKEPMTYTYVPNKEIMSENSNLMQSCSL